MCIGIWTLEHPDYALILCTNRDELLDRPAQNAHFHSFDSGTEDNPVLAGRDIQGGGSWFGTNTSGRIALLTNISEPLDTYSTSRGLLVSSSLLSQSSHPLEDEVGVIVAKNANYAGFNLLLFAPVPSVETGNGSESIRFDSFLVTNHGGGGIVTSRPLESSERRCGCLSNGIDGQGADLWPKVQKARLDFDVALQSVTQETTEDELAERLFKVLSWRDHIIKDRTDLQHTIQVAPMPIVLDGHPQPIYFGTRLSTVVLIRRDGQVLFTERDIWELGADKLPFQRNPPTERKFRFTIDKNALRL